MLPQSFWHRLFAPKFDWLQVAVTSHCNASCAYCPHTVYRRHWQNRHLLPATFRCLLPDLKKVKLVYLQGWGEPFLNPDFFTFVSLAKQAGCQVGTTTNATLLTKDTIAQIVASGIDMVAFSLAGIGETNDIWRRGTSYRQVLEAIQALQECKRVSGNGHPSGAYCLYAAARRPPGVSKAAGRTAGVGHCPGGHQHSGPGGWTGVGKRIPDPGERPGRGRNHPVVWRS